MCFYQIEVAMSGNEAENLRRFDAEWQSLRQKMFGPIIEETTSAERQAGQQHAVDASAEHSVEVDSSESVSSQFVSRLAASGTTSAWMWVAPSRAASCQRS